MSVINHRLRRNNRNKRRRSDRKQKKRIEFRNFFSQKRIGQYATCRALKQNAPKSFLKCVHKSERLKPDFTTCETRMYDFLKRKREIWFIHRHYPIEIKHVCRSCKFRLQDQIEEGLLEPLQEKKLCLTCNYTAITQSYYKICSLCSRLLKQCTFCLRPHDVYRINPIDILPLELEFATYLFPDKLQRDLNCLVYHYWENFEVLHIPIKHFPKIYFRRALEIINKLQLNFNSEMLSDESYDPERIETAKKLFDIINVNNILENNI